MRANKTHNRNTDRKNPSLLLPTPNSHLGFPCLSPAPPVRLIFYGPRIMEARWIPTLAGRRAPFLDAFLSFVRVCAMLKKMRR